MDMTKLRTSGSEALITFAAWVTVIVVKFYRPALELLAFALVTVGMALAYYPLGYIAAGFFLWTVAAGRVS